MKKLLLKKLPYLISAAIIVSLTISTVHLYNTGHETYMNGYEDGQGDAYEQISMTIDEIKYILNTIPVPNEKPWDEEDYPEEGEQLSYIDSEDRWID